MHTRTNIHTHMDCFNCITVDCCNSKLKHLLILPPPPPPKDRELPLCHAVVLVAATVVTSQAQPCQSLRLLPNDTYPVGPVKTGTKTASASLDTKDWTKMPILTSTRPPIPCRELGIELHSMQIAPKILVGTAVSQMENNRVQTMDTLGVGCMYPFLDEWRWLQ